MAPSPATPAALKFPLLDLRAQFATIRDEVMDAIARVMESQIFIMGPEVEALERELAAYTGARHAIACASGSDALLLSLMALDIGPGDEVITVPFTFVATAGSVARLRGTTVFVDVDPVTYNLDPARLEGAITPRTKAIMPVHLFGLAAEMKPILEIAERHNVPVIEDAAQAIGAKYQGRQAGTMAGFGCFSFFPSKNLGGAGDGGLITTHDPARHAKLRVLRNHGSHSKYDYDVIGMNSRLDALQAAILRIKLRHLDDWATGRRRNADIYRALFAEFGLNDVIGVPSGPENCFHVYNQFTIRCAQRDALKDHLRQNGIPSEIYYPRPLHLEPAFRSLGYKAGDFPESERACAEVLSLPIYPELKREQLRDVVATIADFFGRKR